jgi:hypothetical protein
MKKILKLLLIGVMIISINMNLMGCGFSSNKESETAHAKRLLSEKYGEEFEVLDTWPYGAAYYAICSPISDREIIFQSIFNLGDDDFRDEYPQGIVSKQLKEIIEPKMKEVFQECFVHPVIFYSKNNFNRKEDVTIESYVNSVNEPSSLYIIAINKDVYKGDDYKKEYKKLTEITSVSAKTGIGTTGGIYFLPSDLYTKFCDYYKKKIYQTGSFDDIVKGYSEIGFAFKDNKLNKSEDEYIKLREEVK